MRSLVAFTAGDFCPDPTAPEKQAGEMLLQTIADRGIQVAQTPDGMLWLIGDLEMQDIQYMSRHVCPLVWALFDEGAKRQAQSVIQKAMETSKIG